MEGDGAVVTGRFVTRHTVNLVDVRFEGDVSVRGTQRHPVWSEDRQDWVGLGELAVGEAVRGRDGRVRVTSVTPLATPERVFNIETGGEHVYEVSEAGILVHNADPDCELYQALLAKGLHNLNEAEKADFDRLYDKLAPRGGLSGLDTSKLSLITRKNSTRSSDAFRLSAEVVDDVIRINRQPANGAVDFVITKSGELRFGRRHLELADGGDSVFAAGEAFFENGKIIAINRESGHFKPSAADLDRAADFFRSSRLTSADFEAVNFRFNPDKFIRP
jgi:hypothetical protein